LRQDTANLMYTIKHLVLYREVINENEGKYIITVCGNSEQIVT
jgi:hypothetical protein